MSLLMDRVYVFRVFCSFVTYALSFSFLIRKYSLYSDCQRTSFYAARQAVGKEVFSLFRLPTNFVLRCASGSRQGSILFIPTANELRSTLRVRQSARKYFFDYYTR